MLLGGYISTEADELLQEIKIIIKYILFDMFLLRRSSLLCGIYLPFEPYISR